MGAIYDVTDFGAAGDGVTDDRAAIQAAIDTCTENGGGHVLIPGGRVFYSAALQLKPNVDLHLEKGAVLKATACLEDYLRPCEKLNSEADLAFGNPVTGKPAYVFLYGFEAHHCTISGEGVIDGNGHSFVKRKNKYYVTGDFYPRPTVIYIEKSNHISFRDITIVNAPFWTLHPAGCDDVLIDKIRILNDLDVANSDGIDPDHCTNVRILGCHITCADDCICLKTTNGNREYGPCENVLISDCTLISTSAAIKIGTEGVGDFRNILVSNCIISKSNRGLSIQIRDGGNVENVSFVNIIIETRRFSPDWWGTAEPIAITAFDRVPGKPCGKIQNIRFSNILAKGENGVLLHGTAENAIEDVLFENVQVILTKTSRWPCGLYDLRPGFGSKIKRADNSAFYLRHCKNITLMKTRAQWGAPCDTYRHAVDAKDVEHLEFFRFRGAGCNGADTFRFKRVTYTGLPE